MNVVVEGAHILSNKAAARSFTETRVLWRHQVLLLRYLFSNTQSGTLSAMTIYYQTAFMYE